MKTRKLQAAVLSTALFLSQAGYAGFHVSAQETQTDAEYSSEEGGETKNQRYENEDPGNEVQEILAKEETVSHSQALLQTQQDEQSQQVLNGIDISHWNSPISLSALDCDFVIVKATGGTGFIDPSFQTYAKEILESGKLFGFYHFARDNGYKGSAEEEAEFFYEQTKNYIGLGIPVLDWETDLTLGVEWAKAFLDRYYELSGVKCLLYTSAYFTRVYDWTPVVEAGYKLWVAQYADYGDVVGYQSSPWRDSYGTGAFESPVMHQYSSRGKLDGYSGNLDLDIFYGTAEDWQQLTQPASAAWPVYRAYNPNSGEHVYTLDRKEYLNLNSAGWKAEGIAWYSSSAEGIPVYRVYNPVAGDHHYTTSKTEISSLVKAGWIEEGICWYAASNSESSSVFRLYNPNAKSGAHHFTASEAEKNYLISLGWKNEGIGFYAELLQ